MTNREKFKEVFGFEHNSDCPAPIRVCDEIMKCEDCPFDNFFDKEYKGCFKMKEEYDDGK